MSAVPLIFTSGWASGINAYAVVLVLGLFGRIGHVSAVPPTLERADVLAVAGLLFLCEFLVDKIPLLDSLWDVAHTVIRPVLGGAIGMLMASHAHGSLTQAIVSSAMGGGTALLSHLGKAGLRIGVNVSPEPVTNSIISMAEDLVVAIIVGFALLHPLAGALIAATFLTLSLLAVALLAVRIRAYWRDRRSRTSRGLARGVWVRRFPFFLKANSSQVTPAKGRSHSRFTADPSYLTEIGTDREDWLTQPESWGDNDPWK